MKYLRKYNERLSPSTYRSASRKLKDIGHERRSKTLEEWSEVMQKRKDEEYRRELEERLSKFPSFKMDIRKDSWNRNTRKTEFGDSILTGNFYINFSFEPDMLNDHLYDWVSGNLDYGLYLHFDIGLFPADEETRNKLEEVKGDLDEEPWNDMLYGTWFTLKLAEGNGKKIEESKNTPITLEPRETDIMLFSNRKEAVKFKRILVDSFSGNSQFGKSRWAPEGVAARVKKFFIDAEKEYSEPSENLRNEMANWYSANDESPLREEHYNRVLEIIKRMSINPLYRD